MTPHEAPSAEETGVHIVEIITLTKQGSTNSSASHPASGDAGDPIEISRAMIGAGVSTFLKHVGDEPRVYEPWEIVERIMSSVLGPERVQILP